jgi:hypothetical protein
MKNHAHAPSSTFRITPRGPYSLETSAKFLCGFTPAAGGSTTLDDGRLVLDSSTKRATSPSPSR